MARLLTSVLACLLFCHCNNKSSGPGQGGAPGNGGEAGPPPPGAWSAGAPMRPRGGPGRRRGNRGHRGSAGHRWRGRDCRGGRGSGAAGSAPVGGGRGGRLQGLQAATDSPRAGAAERPDPDAVVDVRRQPLWRRGGQLQLREARLPGRGPGLDLSGDCRRGRGGRPLCRACQRQAVSPAAAREAGSGPLLPCGRSQAARAAGDRAAKTRQGCGTLGACAPTGS